MWFYGIQYYKEDSFYIVENMFLINWEYNIYIQIEDIFYLCIYLFFDLFINIYINMLLYFFLIL